MPDQYETISKFDRAVGGLLGGNNLHTKPTTVQHVALTGESEQFTIQTIRVADGDDKGDHVVITFVDKEGVKRLILPPRATDTIVRHRDSLSARARSNSSKAAMRDRMAAGYVPTPPKRKRGK
jgi:hypothetical protein